MTTEAFPGPVQYTVDGTGPYAVGFEYSSGAVLVSVDQNGSLRPLDAAEFSVSPDAGTGGNVTLTAQAATDYAGLQIFVDRATPLEQGFTGVDAREKGLADQLDRTAQTAQENQRGLGRTLRVPAAVDPLSLGSGQMIVGEETTGVPAVRDITDVINSYTATETDYGQVTDPAGTLIDYGTVAGG